MVILCYVHFPLPTNSVFGSIVHARASLLQGLVMRCLTSKGSLGIFLLSTAQNTQFRFAPGIPPLYEQATKVRYSSSKITPVVGEIIVKKSIRVKHGLHGPPGEKLRAIHTRDGDRQLWISFSGEDHTAEDFAQV